MYLKLGNTNIKYNTTRGNFMVIAEVLRSSMGYESPVLVRTVDELETWFGTGFEEKEWLEELLKTDSSLSLFLSCPVSKTPRELPETEGWINYTTFPVDSGIYYSVDMFPEKGSEGRIYRKRLDPLGELWEDYIWDETRYIPVSELPQNLDPEISISFLQRDTLRLGWKDGKEGDWGHCYPSPLQIQKPIENTEENTGFNWENINLENIDQGKETLGFTFQFPTNYDYTQDFYLLLDRVVYYSGVSVPIPNTYYDETVLVLSSKELQIRLEEHGWTIENSIGEGEGGKVILWKPEPTQVTYFYEWEGMSLEPNFIETQKIITPHLTPVLNLWSRTIGRPREEEWEEDNIHIKIEPVFIDNSISPTRWRVTIKRYNYTEVHEGTLNPSDSRIDWVIEKNSKLVHASIPEELVSNLKELPIGDYQLRGAQALTWTSPDLQHTLEWMIDGEKNYYPDYIMVPNPEEWMNEYTAPTIYNKWVEMATEGSYQFLIQNNEENLRWNITTDRENRLVWFWKDMMVNGKPRPGYYLYLLGLLTDIYSMTSGIILYDIPTKNPYSDETSPIEKLLADYKSNYLVCNNQTYFYKEYQNGVNFETTGWMRFIMGKVSRELYKNMGQYIGLKSVGEIMEIIRGILKSILDRFSIIRSLEITNYNVNFKEQRLDLVLETTISDLRENNMTLDVNINYNKN